MSVDGKVASHYSHGDLAQTILTALAAAGKDLDELTPADLAPVDEFHIGGREATVDFAGRFGARTGMHLLDVGCGIGGASRYFAGSHGCRVTGIDLTPEYCAVAATLAEKVGLADQVRYRQANALSMPFEDESFDGAYTFHVAMNIADKAGLYAEIARVLRPDAIFGIYDVCGGGAEDLHFPVPWADDASISFLASPEDMADLLDAAGFDIVETTDRSEFAKDFFDRMRQARVESGPPPLGLHLLMGKAFPDKLRNMVQNLLEGKIQPTEFICRRR